MNGMAQITLVTTIAASVMLLGTSHAETVNTTAELMNNKTVIAYVFSRSMLKTMYRLGVKEDKKFGLQSGCKSQYKVKPFSVIVLKPMEFSEGKKHPTKGVWLTRYQLERCGDSKFYNALFLANNKGEAPMSKAFYPGSTNAGPVLVGDAMMSTAMGALARSGLKDCKKADVFDMRVTEPTHTVVEGEKTFKGVWNEIWTFRMCGQMVDVAMTFIPDANGGGTTFTSGPVKSESTAARP
jgi:hypothetical protein